jgi:hypothetical protein
MCPSGSLTSTSTVIAQTWHWQEGLVQHRSAVAQAGMAAITDSQPGRYLLALQAQAQRVSNDLAM